MTRSRWCRGAIVLGATARRFCRRGERPIRRCVGPGWGAADSMLRHFGQEDPGELGSGWLHLAGLALTFPHQASPPPAASASRVLCADAAVEGSGCCCLTTSCSCNETSALWTGPPWRGRLSRAAGRLCKALFLAPPGQVKPGKELTCPQPDSLFLYGNLPEAPLSIF